MSRRQHTFKQSDVTKALKATVKAGIAVGRVEIDKEGKIVIVPARPEDAADQEKPGNNEWDGVLQ
jgi:predicted aspartyl protease